MFPFGADPTLIGNFMQGPIEVVQVGFFLVIICKLVWPVETCTKEFVNFTLRVDKAALMNSFIPGKTFIIFRIILIRLITSKFKNFK